MSDEPLALRWAENVQWQFFSGMDCYEPRPPCDPTPIGRLRRLPGEDGIELCSNSTIECAVRISSSSACARRSSAIARLGVVMRELQRKLDAD